MRPQQKQWLVDPPAPHAARTQTLLECLPEAKRGWNLCREAARAYVAAHEPPYTIDFWGRGPQLSKNKPLWTLIGQALDVGGTPGSAALHILEEMRKAPL